jgi:hypothetical protein
MSLETGSDTLTALLTEIGRVYPPFMLANAEAVSAGATEMEARIDRQTWRQPPFPYQAKCLLALRRAHGALNEADRIRFDEALKATGCLALFGPRA